MSAIINGSKEAVEQPRRYGYSSSRGAYFVRTWKGTKAAIEALIPNVASQFLDYEVTEDVGPFATLTATVPNDTTGGGGAENEVPVDKWSLEPNKAEKDILDTDLPLVRTVSSDNKNKIARLRLDPPSSSASEDRPGITNGVVTVTHFSGADAAAALGLWNIIKDRTESKIIYQPILKLERTVSINYSVAVATTNVGVVLSSSYLVENEHPPSNFLLALNGAPFNQGLIVGSNFFWGWLKEYPTIANLPFNKVQISQQFQWGLWHVDVYPGRVGY